LDMNSKPIPYRKNVERIAVTGIDPVNRND
jgi:hypothetical protein